MRLAAGLFHPNGLKRVRYCSFAIQALQSTDRNFFKVERWTPGDPHIERTLFAGNRLEKAREKFTEAVKNPPRWSLHTSATLPRAGKVARQ
jgi:hypothetical protein